MEDQEIVKEFLIESSENLSRLDQEMVELEKRPKDADLLASIFRTIHTIKGTCGFLGFSVLEGITHHAENLLSQLRNGERDLSPPIVSLILETIDATRRELLSIENTGAESGEAHEPLRDRLRTACSAPATPAPAAVPDPAPAPPAAAAPAGNAPPSCSAPVPPPAQPPTPAAGAEPVPSTLPAAAANAAEDTPASQRGPAAADSTIRVDVGLLDKLMNLVGELVLARNQILQYSSRTEDAQFTATSQRLNLITTQLQEGVMKTRMQPIGMVWNKLPRVVRDLAAACGKQIGLEMDGADTELDKSIIEAIKDPLTHIVRNSCDHGLESPAERAGRGKAPQGRLTLRAFHEGGQVNIEIIDDGRGIDSARVKSKAIEKGLIRPEQADRMGEREAHNLLFMPGFSTAEKVTNISGRGVGMDVVKTNIEKIGGTVDLTSRPGEGTTVRLKIPLTLAIIPGLVVTSGGDRFVIPQVSLLELLRLEGEAGRKLIEHIHGAPVYRRRGTLLPIAYLNRVLESPDSGAAGDILNIVVLQAEDRQFGLVVDGVNDTQEIVVKPLGKQLKGLTCYAGATIMGDGKVALILDVMGIGTRSGVLGESHGSGRAEQAASDGDSAERQTLLLFRAGPFERLAVPLSVVARLEEFPQSSIEQASGHRVVQYRGQILPLVSLAGELEPGAADTAGKADPAQTVVFSDGERSIGLLVDQIVDITEDQVAVRKKTSRPGIVGSAVVGGKVTDFVDLAHILSAAGEQVSQNGGGAAAGTRVLLVEPSAFARGILRNYLEMAGYRVAEAASVSEAQAQLERVRADIVLTSRDLPSRVESDGGAEILNWLRQRTALARTPVVALTGAGPLAGAEATGSGYRFDAQQFKFDREGMLGSLDRLSSALQGREPAARELVLDR